ncbi:MAG: PBP1A family penicillin-binding protein [Gemmatimonadetes bacterium]|nr:PBP1A family penicillin-binding protein [Gemmatimonadota bacterium]
MPRRVPLVAPLVVVPLAAALAALPATPRAQGAPPGTGAQPPGARSAAPEPWRIIAVPQASVVLGRDGALIGTIGRERRLSVPLRTLPRHVGQAFIAVEDKRFYQHDGVDLVGIAGALKDAARTGDVRGASTITQLLVGNMHPEVVDRRDRSLGRKLREQQAAREMERHYSKEQILEAFLNQIAFGRGVFGIELAARQYFGKGAAELSVAEAASLAAMPKSPVLYDPVRHPDRNLARRNTVLALMREQGYLTPAQAEAAQRAPLRTAESPLGVAPWVADVVRVQAERAGIPVREGGYRLHTTIDPGLQRAAQRALADGVAEVEARAGFRGAPCAAKAPAAAAPGGRGAQCLEGSVVVLDPATGAVRALVGGRDYALSSFNRAVDGERQPGSSFKPFVYAQALAQGLPANAAVADTALRLRLENGQWYAPGNADNAFLGTLTLREALVRSRNPVAVQLGLAVGLDSVAALVRRAGVRAPPAPGPAAALGAAAVQPLDFVAAYAVFDNGGLAVEPQLLVRVEERGGRTVLAPAAPAPRPALDPRVAFIVRDMLRDVVARGTATSVRRVLPERIPVAGKTGTTNDNADVWFVGMTPELVAGVWLGFDTPAPIAPGAAGGTLAAPIAARVLADAYAGRTAAAWQPPPGVVGVELDRATGAPATPATAAADRYLEWFLPGTEPGAPAWPWRLWRAGPLGGLP